MAGGIKSFQVVAPDGLLNGQIDLPASKSISNRMLIINALSNSPFEIRRISVSDDTRAMKEAFQTQGPVIDVGHAGTAMRFLTAYLAATGGEWIITGSDRMKQRPIRILADALISLGAEIEYTVREGFPPLKIRGSQLKGGTLELDGSVSSQYISALLMIAPTLKGGLCLRLFNRVTSRTYIEMTLKLMRISGIDYSWKNNEINVPEQAYRPVEFSVEADWSAAGYWYQLLALSRGGQIELTHLLLSGVQGDEAIADWFTAFGIETKQTGEGITISKTGEMKPSRVFMKFHENPDIAQTMAALCVARRIPFQFSGLETLKIKETNRIAALQHELAKFGALLTEPAEGELSWDGIFHPENRQENPVIETYDDHRMAMAFAPLALAGNPVTIINPGVVTKSYPGFWEDLKAVGFHLQIDR